ncbi:MAG: phage antirepressor KilAC domain-containing protein, partial [Aeromonas sp.]
MELMKTNASPVMSTREVAQLVKSNHSDVKRSAERLFIAGLLTQPLAEFPFQHNGNEYTEYLLNKRDSLVLVARLSPEFTAAVVDRWQELEAKQGPKLPQSYSAALLEAGRLALEVEQRDQLLASQAPKVEFAEQVASVDKGITLSVFAKSVGIGPNRLFAMLRDTKVLMSCRDERWNLPMQEYVDRGYLATREGTYHDSNGALRLKFTPLITGKGQQW